MGENKRQKTYTADEVIAAFDREREEAQEHRRRINERLRIAHERDRSVQRQGQDR